VRTPNKEFPQFEAALSFLPLLPPDDVIRLLRLRVAALERRLTSLRSSLETAAKQGLPPIFAIEGEFEEAILQAELRFVTDFVGRLADGTYDGVDLWRRLHAKADSAGRIDPADVEAAVASYMDAAP
jgi:hypothetical protein